MKLNVAAVIVMFIFSSLVACKESSPASKTPAKKQGADASAENAGDNGNENTDTSQPDLGTSGTSDVSLVPSSFSGTSQAGQAGTEVVMSWEIQGTGDIAVALEDGPDGSVLSQNGKEVSLTWASPVEGSHDIKFILRNMERCSAEESDSDDCEISRGFSSNVTYNSRYDIRSETYSLVVEASGVDSGNGFGNGNGNGGGPLIQKIMDILGVDAGSGSGGLIKGLLAGMGNGKLKDIADKLQQNGGAGGGIGALTSLLGSIVQ